MQDPTSCEVEGSALNVARDFVAISARKKLTQFKDATEFLFRCSADRVELLPNLEYSYPYGYDWGVHMICVVEQTEHFARWLAGLKDLRAKLAVGRRIERAAMGNLGDFKSVGGSISELRVDVAGGYRIYFTRKQHRLIILLVGGDKSSQATDILKARKLAKELK
nr:addiction module killer protein [Pseudomonas plecoglossicida NB2011]